MPNLLGYIKNLIKLSTKQKIVNFIYIFLAILSSFLIYPRILTIILPLFIIYIIFYFVKNGLNKKNIYLLVSLLVIMIISFAIPITKLNLIQHTDVNQIQAFSPKVNIIQMLSLHGSWIEQTNRYIKAEALNPAHWYINLILILLFVVGIYKFYLKNGIKTSVLANTLLVLSIFSIIIYFFRNNNLYVWLTNNNIIFFALREPFKLFIFVLLSEILFIGYIVNSITEKILRMKYCWLCILILLVPLINNPQLFAGMSGQLKSIEYPDSWLKLNSFLNSDKDDFLVLFLPWHQYMKLNFTKNIIQNPAPYFFTKPVIAGDNLEYGEFYSLSEDQLSYKIQKILGDNVNIPRKLKELNVKYIIVSKSADWENYQYLKDTEGLEIIENNNDYILYNNSIYSP
ncbi:MAG: hypothetical protein M1338_05065 [Patescibacteria group bacterium]|nr:hypothetical protein [Patescibacteria group bacterium]